MINLMFGDCLERIKEIPDGSVDLIATDLPYGRTKANWDSIIPFDDLWRMTGRLLKPNGVFITTAVEPFSSLVVSSNLGFYKHNWIWVKGKRITGHLDAKRRPMRNHEIILVFSSRDYTYNPVKKTGCDKRICTEAVKSKSSVYGKQNGRKRYESTERYPVDVLYFDPVDSRKKDHPNQKPVDLYEYLIGTYSNPGDTILDLCMGSGTTGEACINTGRNFIGIENHRPYYEIACGRLGVSSVEESWEVDWQDES